MSGNENVEQAPRISVCIVTGRRIPLLKRALTSVADQVEAPPYEVLVCSDGDADVAAAVHGHLPDARVGFVRCALPGAARNLLVERARGELLLFLDDDAVLRPDALHRLHRLADHHPEAAVFGGPNDTPPGGSLFQAVQGAVLASMVGSGPVRRRYGAHPPGHADERFFILCNLAIRRSAMVPFADDLVCAEENDVLTELARRGEVMFYDPELVAYHERRPTLRGFLSQMHKYGRGRGQLTARSPSSVRPAYLAPSGLLLYALASPVMVAMLGPAALAPFAAYAAAVAASAVWIAGTLRRVAALSIALPLTVLLHACYGAGVLRGLCTRPSGAANDLTWFDRPVDLQTAAPAGLTGTEVP